MSQNPSGSNARDVRILASIRESFAEGLARGEIWSIESQLKMVTERQQSELLRELMKCELAAQATSDPPTLEDYLRRFPRFGDVVRSVFNARVEASVTESDSPNDSDSSNQEKESGLDETRVYDRESLERDRRLAISSTPERIDRYIIEEILGHGGMGVVYRARDVELKRSVALKMILMAGHAGEVQRQRFRTEAEAVARLQHPNIVQVFALGDHEGAPFLALELVEGGNLAEIIGDDAWDPVLSAELCAILARAVHYAHQQGVVHRDLKPANVLISRTPGSEPPTLHGMATRPSDSTRFDGERDTVRAFREDKSLASAASLEGAGTMSNGWTPKVADFGLARTTDTQDITLTGELLGTPKYMSPEQARGERGGPPCDIYAMGCILYRLLTGRTPFHGATTVETLRRVVEDVPVSPRVLQPGLSVDLTTICLKCLEKNPQHRYASARDLADDLGRFLSGDLIHARPASSVERFVKWSRRHPAVASLSFALLAVVVTGFSLVFWQWREAVDLADRNIDLVADRERSLNDAVRLAIQKIELAGKEKAAREEAEKLRGLAERQLGLANTARLAAQSNSVRAKNPVLSLLLALESAKAARAKDEPVQPETFGTLIGSVAGVGGSPLSGHSKPIACVTFSADSRWLATASRGNTIHIWDLRQDTPGDSPVVLTGHQEEVNAAAFTPDDKWLITGSSDNTARVWDLSDRESIQCLLVLPHSGDVSKIDITADGRWLATAGQGVAVYDLTSTNIEESRRPLNGPRGKILGLRFTPNGQTLLAAGDEGIAFAWGIGDRAAAEPTHSLAAPGACRDLAVNRDGTRFGVSCGAQGVVWSLDDLARPPIVLRGHSGIVTALRFSPDGRSVVTSAGDATGRLWDLHSIEPSDTSIVLRGHDHYAAGADISPDGRWAATVAADAQVRLWELTTEKREPTSVLLPGHRGFLDHVKFSPDGRWLVTGGWDQIVRVWDMSENLPTHSPVILRGPGGVTSADLSADDRWLAAGYETGILLMWDLKAPGEPPAKYHGHTKRILNTKISGDGRWVVTGGEDFTARLLDRNSDQPPALFSEGLTRLAGVAISQDGRWVAAGRKDGTVLLRELSELGTDRTLSGLSGPAISLAFSADNRILAMGCRDGSVAILELSKADAALQFSPHRHDGMVLNLRFVDGDRLASFCGREAAHWSYRSKTAPRIFRDDESFATTGASLSGRWLAAGGWDTKVRLWDRESSSDTPFILEGHSGAIDGCVISANDRWLVTSSRDETVMMWDLRGAGRSGSPVVLHGHSGTIRVAMFTNSGDRLITGGNGGSIRIWDLKIDSLMNAARRVAGRKLSSQERRRYLRSTETLD